MEEENFTTPENNVTNESLKRHLTTVTPFSKYLAMILFVALPFVGFWLGMQYQETEKDEGYLPKTEYGENSSSREEQNHQTQQETENDSPYTIQNCEDITFPDSKDNCYFDYAQSRDNSNLCQHILDPERKTQCFDYLSQTDEEILEVYTLSSLPEALGIGDAGEVFFSIGYAGVLEKANIKVYEVTKSGEVVKELGVLNDDGENGDLASGDYLYGGTFDIGPFGNEQEIHYQATLEFPLDDSINTSSELHTFYITRFPTEQIPNFTPIFSEEMVLNEVLVSFKDNVTPDRIEEIVNDIDGTIVDVIYGLNVYEIGLTTNSADEVLRVVEILERYTEVEYAEPNGITSID